MRPSALAAALVVSLAPVVVLAVDVKPASHIDAVTVYATSARVTRVARVELPEGDARVILEGLPLRLLDDSIRLHGQGNARAHLFGVSVETVTRAEAAAAEARAAQERLEALQDEDRALQDDERAAAARRDFVASLRSTYSEERTKNLAVRPLSPREWAEMSDYVAGELAKASAEIRKTQVARRQLERRVQAAQAELSKVQAKRGQTTKSVAVEVRAERAGTFEVEVSYVVPDASWRPIWDARLVPDKQSLELAFHASVQQTSGEDWSDVKLAVSTAQPGRGLHVPDLTAMYVDKFVPRVRAPVALRAEAKRRGMPSSMPAPSAAAGVGAGMAQPAEVEEEPVEAMQAPEAERTEGLLATTFTAPRQESVDGAGRERKVLLSVFPMNASISRRAAPRVDGQTYLTAVAANEAGTALLPGDASIFVGEEFVGRAPLAATPPGGELKLAFGADDRVKVERKIVERRHETAGLVSKSDVYRYRIRTTVKNLYATPITVKLLDQVPVSRDEAIEVKLLDGTTAPTEPEDPMKPGVRAYEVSLDPKQEKAIELRYEVRARAGTVLQGIE